MKRVAIIGSGPAGLFCADRLAGLCDLTVFETGPEIDYRTCKRTNCECRICHVLEGEGGAGGLSDGKNTYSLTRGTQMEEIFRPEDEHWLKYIDFQTVKHAGPGVWYDPVAAPPDCFDNSPLEFTSYSLRHVGSDGIRKFVKGFTTDLKKRGVKFRFNCQAEVSRGSMLIVADAVRKMEFDVVIIAAGLQGIPWVEKFMSDNGSPLRSGPAGFGIRLEVEASAVAELHREFYDYKLIFKTSSGIVVRSFCCNQRGSVINERHTDIDVVNVNGHSFLDPTMRTQSSNLAIIAKMPNVGDPQGFVRYLGTEINKEAGGSAYQYLRSFIGLPDAAFDKSYMTNPQAKEADIANVIRRINPSLYEAFRDFLISFIQVAPGVANSTSVVYAPEIKYYGRRVDVDENWNVKHIHGLYVVGSCSGYLDSFVAAALSGIVAAEHIQRTRI